MKNKDENIENKNQTAHQIIKNKKLGDKDEKLEQKGDIIKSSDEQNES